MFLKDPPPLPPPDMFDPVDTQFRPSEELEAWVRDHFIVDKDDPFYNPEHAHLEDATLGFLWAGCGCKKDGQQVLGMCSVTSGISGTAWTKGQKLQQLREWFGSEPDFVITLDAEWFMEADNASRLAVIDHELYHAAIKKDKWNEPMYDKESNAPVWGIRGHDVEEFVGVVRRWGVFATGAAQMAHAIKQGPTIMQAAIDGICGTCGRAAA